VLSGECTLIVEDEERQLRQWDYFHCPAETHHVIVGAGDGPCAILMLGAPRSRRCTSRLARLRPSTAHPPRRRRTCRTRPTATGPATSSPFASPGHLRPGS